MQCRAARSTQHPSFLLAWSFVCFLVRVTAPHNIQSSPPPSGIADQRHPS
jgi:hypothetical protein